MFIQHPLEFNRLLCRKYITLQHTTLIIKV